MKRFLTMCAGILLICQFTPPLTLAQNAGYEVKGVVVDKSGMPILGATVVEKGTTTQLLESTTHFTTLVRALCGGEAA